MLDLHYLNPKLVDLYDLDSGWSEDRDFYLSYSYGIRKKILDLGCGTGLLANAYAKEGHLVTGVDPSKAMLESAKRKSHGREIEWVESSAQKFNSEKDFDLIVMTGHAFQVLLKVKDVADTFQTMRKHLTSGGTILFESRNPNINWSDIWDYKIELDAPEYKVIESRKFLKMTDDKMSFTLNYEFPEETLTVESELRFWSFNEIEQFLHKAELKIENLYGDWNKSDFAKNSSEEMIFEVKKA